MNERLFFLREQENLTQQELADIFKVSRSLVSKWERDLITITLKQLNNYANYFNVSLDYIVGLSNNKSKTNNVQLDYNLVGKRLAEVREKNNLIHIEEAIKCGNLTLRKLADVLNTTSSTLSAYETGKVLIQTSFAITICTQYNVSLDWLCGRK